MASATLSVTSNQSVVALQKVAKGGKAYGTLDLRTKQGAMLYLAVGRTLSSSPAVGIDVRVRPQPDNGSIVVPMSGTFSASFRATSGAGVATTLSANPGTGDDDVTLSSATSFATGDNVVIFDDLSTPSRAGWYKSSLLSGTTLTLDRELGLDFAITDIVANKADSWILNLPGGAKYEVVFDYGAETAATDVTVLVKAVADVIDSVVTA